jgi:Tol biopolymer transport system component
MGIFISYRRSDSAGWAGRIYDDLVEIWGPDHVYMDIDTIAPGDDFRAAIAATLARSDVVLVVIGPTWLMAMDEDGKRRLDDRTDVHRSEVVSALNRDVRIIPVLVGGATMPEAADLPAPMRQLAFRNAVELDDRHFRSHLESLQEALVRFAEQLADQRSNEADARLLARRESEPALDTAETPGALDEANVQNIGHGGAAPSGPPSSPGMESRETHPSPGTGAASRDRWPASVLLASISVGALVGLIGVAAFLAFRDDDGDDVTTESFAPTLITSPTESNASGATNGVAGPGASFVVFETDRDDPTPDPAQRRHSIWRVNVNGSDARALIASDGSDGHPTLSSDGSQMAYLHTDTPENVDSWDLVVSNVDGSSPRVVVEGVRRTYRPSWSPDDAAIIIPLSTSGQVDLWRIDLSTGQRQQVTDTPEPEYDPDWSTSGLVFRRDVDDDNAEIFVSDTDGSDERRITDHPGYDSDPRWSPDGTRILFTRNFGTGNHEVCAMAPDGSEVVNLTNSPSHDQDAMWLELGGGIVFVSGRDGSNQIYVMENDGSNQQRLMESTSQDGVPDGT